MGRYCCCWQPLPQNSSRNTSLGIRPRHRPRHRRNRRELQELLWTPAGQICYKGAVKKFTRRDYQNLFEETSEGLITTLNLADMVGVLDCDLSRFVTRHAKRLTGERRREFLKMKDAGGMFWFLTPEERKLFPRRKPMTILVDRSRHPITKVLIFLHEFGHLVCELKRCKCLNDHPLDEYHADFFALSVLSGSADGNPCYIEVIKDQLNAIAVRCEGFRIREAAWKKMGKTCVAQVYWNIRDTAEFKEAVRIVKGKKTPLADKLSAEALTTWEPDEVARISADIAGWS